MIRGIFDNPAQLIIVVVLFVLLFGAKRLPDTARGLARSMRIFKSEIKQMNDDDKPATPPPGTTTPPATRPVPEPLEGRIVDDVEAERAAAARRAAAEHRHDV